MMQRKLFLLPTYIRAYMWKIGYLVTNWQYKSIERMFKLHYPFYRTTDLYLCDINMFYQNILLYYGTLTNMIIFRKSILDYSRIVFIQKNKCKAVFTYFFFFKIDYTRKLNPVTPFKPFFKKIRNSSVLEEMLLINEYNKYYKNIIIMSPLHYWLTFEWERGVQLQNYLTSKNSYFVKNLFLYEFTAINLPLNKINPFFLRNIETLFCNKLNTASFNNIDILKKQNNGVTRLKFVLFLQVYGRYSKFYNRLAIVMKHSTVSILSFYTLNHLFFLFKAKKNFKKKKFNFFKIKYKPTDFNVNVTDLTTFKKKIIALYLRKNKIFNKGRYSRNRQLYRTGVYWCIWLNIILVFGLYYYFYRFTFNFSFIYTPLLIFILSIFGSRLIKYRLYSLHSVVKESLFFLDLIFSYLETFLKKKLKYIFITCVNVFKKIILLIFFKK